MLSGIVTVSTPSILPNKPEVARSQPTALDAIEPRTEPNRRTVSSGLQKRRERIMKVLCNLGRVIAGLWTVAAFLAASTPSVAMERLAAGWRHSVVVEE
jgi:hypothetical protein